MQQNGRGEEPAETAQPDWFREPDAGEDPGFRQDEPRRNGSREEPVHREPAEIAARLLTRRHFCFVPHTG